jgi:predicted metal-dependent peptidase
MLDHVKKDVFLGNNAAFLGSILCSVDFIWDYEQPTKVWTDYLKIGWGPEDFMRCSPRERVSTLLHELWHVAAMHHIRQGPRDPKIWNIACDIRINNDLVRDGYEVPDNTFWIKKPEMDANGVIAEEEIYEILIQDSMQMPSSQGSQDLVPSEAVKNPTDLIATVVRAVQAAEMAKQAGQIPGTIKQALNKYLEPVIPWRTVLMQWMTDLVDAEDYSWRKRNRRFQDVYMPSREADEGKLEHLVYFQDTSGSITEKDMIRFNSEIKYVQEVLKPTKLTLIQFDITIQSIREFKEDEPFEDLEIIGGGGTSLRYVREWIEENKPTAAIIFSDLECTPMKALTKDIPIIWAVIRNKNITVPFGKMIHITE